MKICVLVKEVPDAAVQKRIDTGSMRLDRSGENNLNPFDTHAIEAAMQLKEGGDLQVGGLQQLDRLPQLRRHDQRLRLPQVEAGAEGHGQVTKWGQSRVTVPGLKDDIPPS